MPYNNWRSLLMGWTLALALPLSAQADPISDLSMDSQRVGWFPNFMDGHGPMTCPRACSAWTGAPAEGERSTDVDPDTERAYVCKVTRDPAIIHKPLDAPTSHWVYGSQYDSLPVCAFASRAGFVRRSREFMCLCVDRCDKPDLIVSKIHRPVWDGSQSVIEVDITNVGSAPAGASKAELRDYDFAPGVATALTGVIDPEDTVSVKFTLPYWVYDPDASLIVTADVGDDVDECDEKNNRLRFFEPG